MKDNTGKMDTVEFKPGMLSRAGLEMLMTTGKLAQTQASGLPHLNRCLAEYWEDVGRWRNILLNVAKRRATKTATIAILETLRPDWASGTMEDKLDLACTEGLLLRAREEIPEGRKNPMRIILKEADKSAIFAIASLFFLCGGQNHHTHWIIREMKRFAPSHAAIEYFEAMADNEIGIGNTLVLAYEAETGNDDKDAKKLSAMERDTMMARSLVAHLVTQIFWA